MIKAAIFDMDGLMFDTERVGRDAWLQIGEQLGYDNLDAVNDRCLGCTRVRCAEIFEEEFGGAFSLDDMLRLAEPICSAYYAEHGMPHKKGLVPLLEYLKENGILIAMATSSNKADAESNLSMAGVRQYFDAVIGGDMIRRSKPDPDIYLTAARELGVKPENCIGLEDSRNGIKAVHAAGMHGILIPDLIPPDEGMKADAEVILEDLSQVIGWLEEKK